MIQTFDPSSGENIDQFPFMTKPQVYSTVEKVDDAQRRWAALSFKDRAAHILALRDVLLAYKEKLSQLMTREMGKPISQSLSEVEKSALTCEFFAENAERFVKDEIVQSEFEKSYVSFCPLGVILGIMPWNFPLWQVIRFAVPTLISGNAVIIKHAPNVTGFAKFLEKLTADCGFLKSVFQFLYVDVSQVDDVIANPLVRGVSLTGSTRAGRSVASVAGKHLKKCVLELGGNDAYVVLDDFDLATAAEICVTARLINNGQSCIAGKRFIVTKLHYEEFAHQVLQLMRMYSPAPPSEVTCRLGPLARADLRALLHSQVEDSVESGAKLVLGGAVPGSRGYFYPATLLTKVLPGMPAFDEEVFGPVASIVVAQDEDHAISLANQSTYGLGAVIFSKNLERAQILARQLQCGMVFVNDFVKSDPRFPFGGVKDSGFGRELSAYGLREFLNIKMVVVA